MSTPDDQSFSNKTSGTENTEEQPQIELSRLTRSVMVNQLVWTAGYSLTSGGFLLYFAKGLGAEQWAITVLLVLPEMLGITGLFGRKLLQRFGSSKRFFLTFSLLARCCMLAVPFYGFRLFRADGDVAFASMIGVLAISYILQEIAYVIYIAWISELAPQSHWGRFFAWRNIAKLVSMLTVPVAGGFLRDWWRHAGPPEEALLAYEIAFSLGVVLLTVSLLPMLKVPDVSLPPLADAVPSWKRIREAWREPSMRFLLLHAWCLAFANGLTQQAFFSLTYGHLGIQLGMYYGLSSLMQLVKLPVSWFSGRQCDRSGNLRPLVIGLIIASSGLVFWLLATKEQWWWVIPAYTCWGFYAMANIAGRNLALELSPAADRLVHFALFRQVSGVCAGMSGLLGGWWLGKLFAADVEWSFLGRTLGAAHVIIVVSLIGRYASLLWLIPVREPSE
ncbi:MFS transporter [Thalassoroseus pseudoceratinae]|uniref:MFS transporter n=1 Tax=Thalassoroseus pseudoceratinae TaxID=2713176 RepID=UPI0014210DA9|nr:MFS transporter [Thalassoroseus pseudoceratinae]